MRHYDDFSEAWITELEMTRYAGISTAPRGMPTKERQWVEFSIEDPLTFPVAAGDRTFAHVIGLLEGCSLVGQFSVPELLTARYETFNKFTDSGVFHGSYGNRVTGLLDDLVKLLTVDPDSRQAVLTVYDSTRDLNRKKTDIPCTINMQFLRSGHQLGMRVNMRSNDLWLGTPYDFTQFAMLQASVVQALVPVGITELGRYVHTVGSLHLYDRNDEAASKIDRLVGLPPAFPFPLWSPEVTGNIGEISKRARDLSFGQITPETEFEQWAMELL